MRFRRPKWADHVEDFDLETITVGLTEERVREIVREEIAKNNAELASASIRGLTRGPGTLARY